MESTVIKIIWADKKECIRLIIENAKKYNNLKWYQPKFKVLKKIKHWTNRLIEEERKEVL